MHLVLICALFQSISYSGCDVTARTMTNPIKNERSINNVLTRNITGTPVKNLKTQHISYPEDALLNFTAIAKKYILPAEEYDITTQDGYILKLFHIPGNKSKAVLICHGLLSSSDDFLIRGNISLIYMLAEQDFDIWAMNFRGNRYSRRHITLNPDTDRLFWKYSMHEIGLYDYKAVIDFILDRNDQDNLSVVAHSMGTSAFFILMTERPEYNNKIKVFVGLAPASYLRHTGPTMVRLFQMAKLINTMFKILKIDEFSGYYSFCKTVVDIICAQGYFGYNLCFNILGLVTGFNTENIEEDFASTILGHFPAGTSRRTLLHFVHIYRLNRFCQYDYGKKNFAIYGSFNPPDYDLRKVTAKMALFAADGDLILGVEDVKRLRQNLLNVVHYQVVSDKKFNHIDYLWSRNANSVLYGHVIDILIKYNL